MGPKGDGCLNPVNCVLPLFLGVSGSPALPSSSDLLMEGKVPRVQESCACPCLATGIPWGHSLATTLSL